MGSERVVAAMSGGVDSSVAAALLVESGLDVVGVTLRLKDCTDAGDARSCCGTDGEAQARAVAGALGIPHYVVDARDVFRETVLAPSWDDYRTGRTPNPCVNCNRDVKFGLLFQRAAALGADRVATGHYARIACDQRGIPMLLRGRSRNKDQSYFLFSLGRERLGRVMFPLGDLHKNEVREHARRLGLGNAERHESQDACLGGRGEPFPEALRRLFEGSGLSGRILDESGTVLGRHDGIHKFTIGQRQGLGVAQGVRAWVRSLDPGTGDVITTTDPDRLLATRFTVRDMEFLDEGHETGRFESEVQVRYRSAPVRASIEVETGRAYRVTLAIAVRALTPGQAVVFYNGDRVIAGGWLDSVEG
jgi:tRNA-specific 2-thiouridylase